jgi:hypothetical protein
MRHVQVRDMQRGHYQQQHLQAGPHHGWPGLQHTVSGKQRHLTSSFRTRET